MFELRKYYLTFCQRNFSNRTQKKTTNLLPFFSFLEIRLQFLQSIEISKVLICPMSTNFHHARILFVVYHFLDMSLTFFQTGLITLQLYIFSFWGFFLAKMISQIFTNQRTVLVFYNISLFLKNSKSKIILVNLHHKYAPRVNTIFLMYKSELFLISFKSLGIKSILEFLEKHQSPS